MALAAISSPNMRIHLNIPVILVVGVLGHLELPVVFEIPQRCPKK